MGHGVKSGPLRSVGERKGAGDGVGVLLLWSGGGGADRVVVGWGLFPTPFPCPSRSSSSPSLVVVVVVRAPLLLLIPSRLVLVRHLAFAQEVVVVGRDLVGVGCGWWRRPR